VSNNLNAIYRVADARTTPMSGVRASTEYFSGGGAIRLSGSGMTPGGTVKAFAVGPAWVGPYSMGSVVANGSGAVNGYVGNLSCRRDQWEPATIVVLDTKTGNVTNAGTTGALQKC
jgi:hypothetical protein